MSGMSMADTDRDVRHLLQVVEHLLDDVDKVSGVARHLLNTVQSGKPLTPVALQHYEPELSELSTQRERMRGIIAQWWSLLEAGH